MDLRFIERDGYVLAIRPERPDWGALNDIGAEVLRRLADGERLGQISEGFVGIEGLNEANARRLVANFARETERLWDDAPTSGYHGRARYLRPRRLRELWVHINNRCNCSCRHCLVSSGPNQSDGLPTSDLRRVLDEAAELGVKTFFVTGGEPLLRGDLPELLAGMLSDDEGHVVVLTNGSLITGPFLQRIAHLDRERLHLQVSLDGSTPELNDRLRSPGAFAATTAGLCRALAERLDVTVATVVVDENLSDLPHLVTLLAEMGVRAQHLMWQHVRERGAAEGRARLDDLIERVLALKDHADERGVVLDNFENYRGIANGQAGVKRDLTNACWDSLAIYVDGCAYPSAALVGIEQFRGGVVLNEGLEAVWRGSEAFERYRSRSAVDLAAPGDDPLLFCHGGGDPEHAFFFGRLNGGKERDPYLPLYQAILYRVIDEVVADRRALIHAADGLPLAYQMMGQDGLGCPVQAGVENVGPHKIDFAHSNCVLIQDVIGHSRELVRDFYAEAAIEPKQELCCPTAGIDRRYLSHIPQDVLQRSYGCGSPVFEAGVHEGETIVDLGSGGGIECFIASKMVGPEGRIIGVDMTPEMLNVANQARDAVANSLGYRNIEFVRGYLEALPLGDAAADLVLSNCVINLSPEKLRVFSEVRRVLRPGGRMVIADIVAEREPTERVKYNPRLRGECIAGALTEDAVLLMLSKLGFDDVKVEKRTPWREVDGVQFYSDTITARRPECCPALPAYVVDLDAEGGESAVCCSPDLAVNARHRTGCSVCGEPLEYLDTPAEAECHYCGRQLRTRARCVAGHYVCDRCHGGDYLSFVHSFVAQCELTDPLAVFIRMRDAYPFPVHGPEHHALVPAAFLAAYRNSGGAIDGKVMEEAILEGAGLPGGTCGYWGACAGALGIGIAYSAILGATPLSRGERGAAQAIASRALARLAELEAPRCCQRESLIALEVGAECSREMLPTPVATSHRVACEQMPLNKECIGAACPYAAGYERERPRREKAAREAP